MTSAPHLPMLLDQLFELLDIPPSYYKKAESRYRSLYDWFRREKSVVRGYAPDFYPQGSFRYGTVIRPLLKGDEYDLDLVCQLQASKSDISQAALKRLVGIEVQSYAESNGIKENPEEKRRCWRIDYQDEVRFHMDILPSVPDDDTFKAALVAEGVPPELAQLAIAITDNTHPNYEIVCVDWPRSNPRGFARWFESRMAAVAQSQRQLLVANREYASIEDVPAYEWKTPLQRAIQILKRHRDVMFQDSPEDKPISMVLTTLAAHSYAGELELATALPNIVERMPMYVRNESPQVPNPVNPAEDFADKWNRKPSLRDNFWRWHAQVQSDLELLKQARSSSDWEALISRMLDVDLPPDSSSSIAASSGWRASTPLAVPVVITSPDKPWRSNE